MQFYKLQYNITKNHMKMAPFNKQLLLASVNYSSN